MYALMIFLYQQVLLVILLRVRVVLRTSPKLAASGLTKTSESLLGISWIFFIQQKSCLDAEKLNFENILQLSKIIYLRAFQRARTEHQLGGRGGNILERVEISLFAEGLEERAQEQMFSADMGFPSCGMHWGHERGLNRFNSWYKNGWVQSGWFWGGQKRDSSQLVMREPGI